MGKDLTGRSCRLPQRRLVAWERLLLAARREAHHAGAPTISSGHLLLGVLAEPNSTTARHLADRRIDRHQLAARLAAATRHARDTTGRGQRPELNETELDRDARAAVSVALAATPAREVRELTPDDLAVGLVATKTSVAYRLLTEAGARPADLLNELMERLPGSRQRQPGTQPRP